VTALAWARPHPFGVDRGMAPPLTSDDLPMPRAPPQHRIIGRSRARSVRISRVDRSRTRSSLSSDNDPFTRDRRQASAQRCQTKARPPRTRELRREGAPIVQSRASESPGCRAAGFPAPPIGTTWTRPAFAFGLLDGLGHGSFCCYLQHPYRGKPRPLKGGGGRLFLPCLGSVCNWPADRYSPPADFGRYRHGFVGARPNSLNRRVSSMFISPAFAQARSTTWWALVAAADDGDHRSDHEFLGFAAQQKSGQRSPGLGQELAARRYRGYLRGPWQVTQGVDDEQVEVESPRAAVRQVLSM